MYDHKAVLNAELNEGETLLWSDQPRQGLFLRPSDTVMIPFSLIWGGFALMWEYEVISGDAPWLLALFGLPFVIVGLYLIAGRFFYDAKIREKTFYGITDHRIIILSGINTKQARYMPIDEIEDLYLFEKPDGSGAIVLGPEAITTAYQSELAIPGQKEATPRLNHIR
ncbi:MAG: hypothetical protein AUJ57_08525 [Zetaproteobacteria bacterium CG1_02_53_45]|nr:MAG: hypothetical protein AUJ57_08525 [Zetaproteobacteria bacterium CG1_02_53_45]